MNRRGARRRSATAAEWFAKHLTGGVVSQVCCYPSICWARGGCFAPLRRGSHWGMPCTYGKGRTVTNSSALKSSRKENVIVYFNRSHTHRVLLCQAQDRRSAAMKAHCLPPTAVGTLPAYFKELDTPAARMETGTLERMLDDPRMSSLEANPEIRHPAPEPFVTEATRRPDSTEQDAQPSVEKRGFPRISGYPRMLTVARRGGAGCVL